MTTKDEAFSTERALKLALEALDGGHIDRAYGYIQSALEQPAPATELREQEPAFYRHEDGHLMTPDRAKFLGFDLNDLQALYTSPPPQRQARSADTWVGLTDEDINVLLGQFPRYSNEWDEFDFHVFARAIEAAHGIKENT